MPDDNPGLQWSLVMTSNATPHRLPLTASDALLATYLAGSVTISITIPYQTVGFATVPAASFQHIADLSPFVAASVYFLLFFAIVMLSGSRLLIGIEAIEHHNVFGPCRAAASPSLQFFERWLRVACIVFAEALLIFATLPGSALFVALTICTVLMLIWDIVIARCVKTGQVGVPENHDWSRLSNWARTDGLCFAGLLLGFVIAAIGRYIGPQSAGTGQDAMSAFDVMLIAAATAYVICVMIAVVFEFLDHRDIYGNAMRVVPLSIVLGLVFVGILLLSGAKLNALTLIRKPPQTPSTTVHP